MECRIPNNELANLETQQSPAIGMSAGDFAADRRK